MQQTYLLPSTVLLGVLHWVAARATNNSLAIPACRPVINEASAHPSGLAHLPTEAYPRRQDTPRYSGGPGVNLRTCCDMSRVWVARFNRNALWSLDSEAQTMDVLTLARNGLADQFAVHRCDGLNELVIGAPYRDRNCQASEEACLAQLSGLAVCSTTWASLCRSLPAYSRLISSSTTGIPCATPGRVVANFVKSTFGAPGE